MLRSLKSLSAFVIVLILGAVGIISQASASEFHCSVEPCRYTAKQDGAGKTAHQVLLIKGGSEAVSFTCETFSGEGTSATKTASIVLIQSIVYGACTVNGSPGLTFVMNGCGYKLSSAGTMTVTGCNAGEKIEIKIGTECTYTIGEQGPLSAVKYHTIGASPTREVTVETSITGLAITIDGTQAACKINPNQTITGEFSTGNYIVTGETSAAVMADAWFE